MKVQGIHTDPLRKASYLSLFAASVESGAELGTYASPAVLQVQLECTSFFPAATKAILQTRADSHLNLFMTSYASGSKCNMEMVQVQGRWKCASVFFGESQITTNRKLLLKAEAFLADSC